MEEKRWKKRDVTSRNYNEPSQKKNIYGLATGRKMWLVFDPVCILCGWSQSQLSDKLIYTFKHDPVKDLCHINGVLAFTNKLHKIGSPLQNCTSSTSLHLPFLSLKPEYGQTGLWYLKLKEPLTTLQVYWRQKRPSLPATIWNQLRKTRLRWRNRSYFYTYFFSVKRHLYSTNKFVYHRKTETIVLSRWQPFRWRKVNPSSKESQDQQISWRKRRFQRIFWSSQTQRRWTRIRMLVVWNWHT